MPTSLVFFGLSSNWQAVFQGVILMVAVAIDGYRAQVGGAMTQTPHASQSRGIRRRSPHHPVRDILTGPVASIALTLIVVVIVGADLGRPTVPVGEQRHHHRQFVAIPMIVGAFAGFALLAGVVDLSIGSMVGLSSGDLRRAAPGNGLALGAAQWRSLPPASSSARINAVAIVGFGADPIAATLGMLTALRGSPTSSSTPSAVGSIFAFDVGSLHVHQPCLVGPLPLLFLHRACSSSASPHRRQQDAARPARPGRRRR